MNDNIIIADLTNRKSCIASPRYQYDYGQILEISGVDLPHSFEAHFSLTDTGESITQVGMNNRVTVPDTMLMSGRPVNVWIFLHDGEEDGRTVYFIQIPVRRRAIITDEEPTPEQQSAITQAIAAMDAAVERCEDAVTHSPKIEKLLRQ